MTRRVKGWVWSLLIPAWKAARNHSLVRLSRKFYSFQFHVQDDRNKFKHSVWCAIWFILTLRQDKKRVFRSLFIRPRKLDFPGALLFFPSFGQKICFVLNATNICFLPSDNSKMNGLDVAPSVSVSVKQTELYLVMVCVCARD